MHLLALAAALSLAASSDVIRVSPGAQEVLRIPGLTKVAISATEVADVRVTGPNELLVSGRQRGKTSLTVWANGKIQNRTIVVDDGKGTDIARMVKENVNPSLRVETFNDRVVIDGMVDSVDELRRLEVLVGDDPNVKLMVKLNPRVLPVIAQLITEAFKKNGIGTARAVVVGQKIFLEGSVADATEMAKAQRIADAYYAGAGFQ
jgi:Flp pilus assembly secretin CpaC